jgi:hypothetical protein
MTPHKPTGGESAITRKSLAAEWDREDAIVEAANRQKRDGANRYRAQLAAKGWSKEDIKAELEGFRKAFARRRAIATKGIETVEALDAIAEEILVEISGSNAPRATRVEIIEEFDAETGEIIERDSNTADASQVAADLSGGEGDALSAEQAEPSDAAVTEGNDLREPLAAATGQILREGDAPLEVSANVTGEVLLQQVEHPESNFEPEGASIGEMPSTASAPTAGEAIEPASPVVTLKQYAGPRESKGLPRPVGCLHVDCCGSSTWRKACHTCERAMGVTAGGQAIEHQGVVH